MIEELGLCEIGGVVQLVFDFHDHGLGFVFERWLEAFGEAVVGVSGNPGAGVGLVELVDGDGIAGEGFDEEVGLFEGETVGLGSQGIGLLGVG